MLVGSPCFVIVGGATDAGISTVQFLHTGKHFVDIYCMQIHVLLQIKFYHDYANQLSDVSTSQQMLGHVGHRTLPDIDSMGPSCGCHIRRPSPTSPRFHPHRPLTTCLPTLTCPVSIPIAAALAQTRPDYGSFIAFRGWEVMGESVGRAHCWFPPPEQAK